MGDGSQLVEILESIQGQPAKIHDIKVQCHSSAMHAALVAQGSAPLASNKSITVKIPVSNKNILIKALVYPKTIQFDVACSYKPLVKDKRSLEYLTDILEEASTWLREQTGVTLPSVLQWIITHYHLNKDGQLAINGRDFHITVEDNSNVFTRYYSKQIEGKTIARLEQIRTPRVSLLEFMKEAVRDE